MRRRTKATITTIVAILAYLALALLISMAQTLPFMVVFVACLFGVTSAYVYTIIGSPRPQRKSLTFRISGTFTMLVGYLVIWFYWGSGNGPFSPYNGLFGSRITLYCPPYPAGCIQISSWLIFAAFVIASSMLLWPLKTMMAQVPRRTVGPT